MFGSQSIINMKIAIVTTILMLLVAPTIAQSTSPTTSKDQSLYSTHEVRVFFEDTMYEEHLSEIYLPKMLFRHKEFRDELMGLDFNSILFIRYNGILHYGQRELPQESYTMLTVDCKDGATFTIGFKTKD